MIEWRDIYKVVVAMAPLYAALVLGYGSVKWWHMFKPEHSDAINRFNCFFILPFFAFEFTSHVNPYTMNYHFLAGDVISKCIIGVVLGLWANFSTKGGLSWSITIFSLSSLNNTLVVGVPLLEAMYGQMGVDLVVQSSVIQALMWFVLLLFLLELQSARSAVDLNTTEESPGGPAIELGKDLEASNTESTMINKPPSFWAIMKIVWLKIAKNPNSYACFIGIIWAFLAVKWHFQMPGIIEGSILIMSKAGSGVSMFNMGLFMALQGKLISCGASKTLLGMALRFVFGPLAMAIGSVAMGLRGNVLKVAVMQAALPQSITSFVYAQQYGLHADVLSTAVIFGTLASLPLLIAYYAILDFLH